MFSFGFYSGHFDGKLVVGFLLLAVNENLRRVGVCEDIILSLQTQESHEFISPSHGTYTGGNGLNHLHTADDYKCINLPVASLVEQMSLGNT